MRVCVACACTYNAYSPVYERIFADRGLCLLVSVLFQPHNFKEANIYRRILRTYIRRECSGISNPLDYKYQTISILTLTNNTFGSWKGCCKIDKEPIIQSCLPEINLRALSWRIIRILTIWRTVKKFVDENRNRSYIDQIIHQQDSYGWSSLAIYKS